MVLAESCTGALGRPRLPGVSWRRYFFEEVDDASPSLWARLERLFLPRDETDEPLFREELSRISVAGLRTGGLVQLGAIFWAVLIELVAGERSAGWISGHTAGGAVGLAALGASYWRGVRPYARGIGAAMSLSVALIVIVIFLLALPERPAEDHHLPGTLLLIMLVAVALFPFRPLQAMAFGSSITLIHLASIWIVPWLFAIPVGGGPAHVLLTALGVLIAAGLTAVIYRQRADAFRAREAARQALRSLQETQSRLLLSETAASQGRLAAALSHELNSPLGVVTNTMSSLKSYFDREERPSRSNEPVRSLVKGGYDAAERLTGIVNRMNRFTNLDRAEIRDSDLNEILTDTVGMLSGELSPRARTTLDLQPLPRIRCRPQTLSAVFSTLLRNAAESMDGQGHIRISSRRQEREIVIELRDNGRGIASEKLPHLFEPAFAVKDGRVGTSNWSLFSSRSIVVEHGGHLEIESEEGEGTLVRVSLPF